MSEGEGVNCRKERASDTRREGVRSQKERVSNVSRRGLLISEGKGVECYSCEKALPLRQGGPRPERNPDGCRCKATRSVKPLGV